MRKFEHCRVCGEGRIYGAALGLLMGTKPAPESVVNQVLVAADLRCAQSAHASAPAKERGIRYDSMGDYTRE